MKIPAISSLFRLPTQLEKQQQTQQRVEAERMRTQSLAEAKGRLLDVLV